MSTKIFAEEKDLCMRHNLNGENGDPIISANAQKPLISSQQKALTSDEEKTTKVKCSSFKYSKYPHLKICKPKNSSNANILKNTKKNEAFSATGLVQCTSCNIFRVPHPQHLVLIHVFVRKVSILRSNSPRLAPPPTQNLPDPPLFLPPPSNIMMALLSLFLLSGANSTTNFYTPPTLLSLTPLCSSRPRWK